MFHLDFTNGEPYQTAVLIKQGAMSRDQLRTHYVQHLGPGTMAWGVDYDGKKPSAKCRRAFLANLLPILVSKGIEYILCCDGEYYKTLTGMKSAEPNIGYVKPCNIKGFEDLHVVYAANYQQYFHKPVMEEKTMLSLQKLSAHRKGDTVELGSDILKNVVYPDTPATIKAELMKLMDEPALTLDIEGFSLKHYHCGIGTLSVSKDKHSAVAFTCDYKETLAYEVEIWDQKDKKFKKKTAYGIQEENPAVREVIKWFLCNYKGKMIWHNACFDVYILIYQLWMDGLLDRKGLLEGLEIMTKNVECSQIITYLATNSCAGNKLSLKEQAHEFAGDYGIEVKDIRLQPLPDLLKYNAVDTCSTWYTYEKNYPRMVKDDQEGIYKELLRECITDIVDIQLTGMCMSMDAVLDAEKQLTVIRDTAIATVTCTPIVQEFAQWAIADEVTTRNAAYKTKVIDASEAKFKVNLNSGKQMRKLLYEFMELPILDKTDSGAPAVGNKTLDKLLHHVDATVALRQGSAKEAAQFKAAIQSIIDYTLSNKILTSFIRVFKEAPLAEDGYHYLFGSYKLGGTVSGRLSSSNPNMQNIPSGSTFAKLIKKCFIAPKGWLFGGADSASLEDRIDALLTKDPNKLKVYTDGFDGHLLRAYHYFPESFVGIAETADAINACKKSHAQERQDSKAPTFALTYLGTWVTLMTNCGFSEEKSKRIEGNYHKMYVVSDEWKAAKIQKASDDGFAIVAFGLKVRTPLLAQVVLNNSKTPYEAAAESRTVGNAFGQSYGLLNSRAGLEVMRKVRASKYKYDVMMCAQIHDALYFRWRDSIELTKWLNDIIGEAMAWQELPEIAHDEVKLSGELDIFYPTWNDAVTLKNYITTTEIRETCLQAIKDRKEAKKKKELEDA